MGNIPSVPCFLEIEAADGTIIEGFTEHGIDRVIGDGSAGVSGVRAGTRLEAILGALKNPTKPVESGVDSLGRPFKTFVGKDAKVVVNPVTKKIVSVNPLSRGRCTLSESAAETVTLTHEEFEFVQKLRAEDSQFQMLLRNHPSLHVAECKLILRREDAAALREYMSDRFDVFGLDIEYKPTQEGKLLESLVDKLFWPEDD